MSEELKACATKDALDALEVAKAEFQKAIDDYAAFLRKGFQPPELEYLKRWSKGQANV